MHWQKAVEDSPFLLAYALVDRGKAIRMINEDGEIFKIESPWGTPTNSDNTKRRVGSLLWHAVVSKIERFKFWDELVAMASANSPEVVCDLHAGPRGLAAMSTEWANREVSLKGFVDQLHKTEFDDPNLPDLLDQIITHATKMRDML